MTTASPRLSRPPNKATGCQSERIRIPQSNPSTFPCPWSTTTPSLPSTSTDIESSKPSLPPRHLSPSTNPLPLSFSAPTPNMFPSYRNTPSAPKQTPNATKTERANEKTTESNFDTNSSPSVCPSQPFTHTPCHQHHHQKQSPHSFLSNQHPLYPGPAMTTETITTTTTTTTTTTNFQFHRFHTPSVYSTTITSSSPSPTRRWSCLIVMYLQPEFEETNFFIARLAGRSVVVFGFACSKI